MHFPGHLLPGLAAMFFFLPQLSANDEPPELQQARTQFEKEVDFALRPMRDRYVARLQTLKRSLVSKGELRAAVVVQDEIDLIVATVNESAILARYVGSWIWDFGGGKRRFSIKPDGVIEYFSETGALHASGRLTRIGKDFVFVWETLDQIDRVAVNENTIIMETFSPKNAFPRGTPATRVTLIRTALNK